MCVMIYHPKGKKIEATELHDHARTNSHGFGIMFVKDGLVEMRRFLNVNSMISSYNDCLKKYPESPFALHFRFATGGTRTLENCHPFAVVKDTMGMMHNGVINTVGYPQDVGKSDTYIFNKYVLSEVGLNAMHNESTKVLINRFIGSHNKLILMTKDNFGIYNANKGEWIDGIWRSFKKPVVYTSHNVYDNYPFNSRHKKCEICTTTWEEGFMYRVTNMYNKDSYVCRDCGRKLQLDKLFDNRTIQFIEYKG